MKRIKPEKEKLEQLLSFFGSVGKVAANLSIPLTTMRSWYTSYGIEMPPSCMNMYNELREIELTSIQKSVVLGSILGDGSLLKNKRSKNARLQIGHCTKQLGYLEWKKELLNPFVRRVTKAEEAGPKIIVGIDSFSTGYYFINTIAHPSITFFYNKYYKNGKKRVHDDMVNDLDLLSLAIWLADDASFSLRKECRYSLRGSIATCSFTKEENEVLIQALKKFYTGHVSVGRDNVLYLSGTEGIEQLLDLVVSVLPETIHYKFAPQRLNAKPRKGEDIV